MDTYGSCRWTLHHGAVQHVMPTLEASRFDAVFCDPPYGIGFMEHGWDKSVPPASVWEQVLSVSKPGAFLLAFGGTKTFHQLVCNIQDAGWEIRDTLCWLYAAGMPKGCNIGKWLGKRGNGRGGDWSGYNTTLKPAWEPIILAQKPREGSFGSNAHRHGCGGLNIDACRIPTAGAAGREEDLKLRAVSDTHGRWPSNLLMDEEAAAELDRQSGRSRSCRSVRRKINSNAGNGRTMHHFRCRSNDGEGYSDEGGASRFFFVAKASKKERSGNQHPTVKPLKLCEYLARLILPPERDTPRQLLVPFSGSGSEMIGGLRAGWDHAVGVESEGKYVRLARKRLDDADDGLSLSA